MGSLIVLTVLSASLSVVIALLKYAWRRRDTAHQVEPNINASSGKSVTLTASLVSICLLAILLPSAYSLLADYQIQSLKHEGARLSQESASLDWQEATLLSPERMEELARVQVFIDPGKDKVVYLDPQNGNVAIHRLSPEELKKRPTKRDSRRKTKQ